jgi:electron transfer flavoprotein alpha subunit
MRRSDAGRAPAVATCLPWGEIHARGDDEAEVIMVQAGGPDLRLQLESQEPAAVQSDPSFCRVLVGGGAGMGTPENFELLDTLARALGGALVGTETAVQRGLLPSWRAMNLPGRRLSPQLYLCFGASGSAEHLRALRSDPVIVAINTDPRAPILKVARFGLLADGRTVAERLLQQLEGGQTVRTGLYDPGADGAATRADGLDRPRASFDITVDGVTLESLDGLDGLETLDSGPPATGEEPSS